MSYKKYLIGFVLVLVLVVGVVLVSRLNIPTETANQLGGVRALLTTCEDKDNTDLNNSDSFYTPSYVLVKGKFAGIASIKRPDKKVCSSGLCTLSEAYCSGGQFYYKSNINCLLDGGTFTSAIVDGKKCWACKKACVPNCSNRVRAICGASDGCAGKCSGSCPDGKSCDSLKKCVDTCTDTDGGKSINLKGTVTANGQTYTDSCDLRKVVENYCSNNIRQTRTSTCPIANGRAQACLQGACAVFDLLPAPTNLAFNIVNDSAYLSWSPVPNASAYRFWYFKGGSTISAIDISSTLTAHKIGTLATGYSYVFFIAAVNFAGEAGSSASVSRSL